MRPNSSEVCESSSRLRSAVTNGREGPPRVRSAVTNGRRLFVESDGRGPWGRRFRDVLAQIVADLGGADLLSEGQRQLARRAATISIACERMEGEAAAGVPIDLDEYGKLTDRLGRAFQRLGLKREPRDVTPTLAELIAQDEAEQAAEEAAKTAAEEAARAARRSRRGRRND